MRFALLGIDPPMLELALAVAASPDHELVWLWGAGGHLAVLMQAAPRATVASQWESLLADSSAEAVLVAADGAEEERAERLRRLAQAAIPAVVSHPIARSMLLYYELDMICQQSGGVLLPYIPGRWHPLWSDLQALSFPGLSDGSAWETLAIERCCSGLQRGQILDGFVRDIELARGIAGDLLRVTAMAGADDRQLATLCVTAAGQQLVVRWSAVPGNPTRGVRAVLNGPCGQWEIEMPEDGTPWRAAARLGPQAHQLAYPEWKAAEASLPRLVQALTSQPSPPTWVDAARGMELADAVERSLQRGRTIDMHYGEHNEAETFKAVMSGAGCLMLALALVALLLGTLARGLGLRLADFWPYVLVGVLLVFLLAQTLRFVLPPSSKGSPHAGPPQTPAA